MPDPMIGEIRMFAGSFAPLNWAFCNGQILAIQSNTALFSILGTYYGGNGTTTFGLPNLQSRVPVGAGQGPGLTDRMLGELGGVENVTLQVTEMPAHSHGLQIGGNSDYTKATVNSPANDVYGSTDPNNQGLPMYSQSSNASMGPSPSGTGGNGLPHPNIQPSLCVSFIVCMYGRFPARN